MIDFQVTKMYLNIVHSVYWAKLLLSIDLALFIVTFFLAVCVCVCVLPPFLSNACARKQFSFGIESHSQLRISSN